MNQDESALTKYEAKIEDYSNDSILERRWAIVYVGGKTFFLTDEEREKFLIDLKKGATIAQVGGVLTLSNRFSYIYALRDKGQDKGSDYEIIDGKAVRKSI